jgi:hypothetical protein
MKRAKSGILVPQALAKEGRLFPCKSKVLSAKFKKIKGLRLPILSTPTVSAFWFVSCLCISKQKRP